MVIVLIHLCGAPGPAVPGAGAGAEALTIDNEGELTRPALLSGAVNTGYRRGGGGGGTGARVCAAWDKQGLENIKILVIEM